MAPQSPLKTDLVIAMTLAEIFLLLLFVVWTSVATEKTAADPWAKLAEDRRREIEQLRNQMDEQVRRIAKLEAKLNYWNTEFNADPPQSNRDLVGILTSKPGKAVLAEAGRGYPRCEDQNTLVRASVVRGAIKMDLFSESARLRDWSAESGIAIPAPQAVLSDWDSIHSFLAVVNSFYQSREAGTRCRFDYRLTYETKEDYHDGREAFEGSFYPSGISRVSR